MLEILLCARVREIEARHFDPRDLVGGDCSASCIGIGVRGRGACRQEWSWIIVTQRGMASGSHRWCVLIAEDVAGEHRSL
jgi:hypothetical protein